MSYDVFGKRCTVLGLGVSNLPLIDYLLKNGAHVCARDRRDIDTEKEPFAAFAARGVQFVCGERYLEGLDGDILFRSPGIRPDLPEIADAVHKGMRLSSEMELFFELCPAKLFAVTGSDGKTTTTTLVHLLLSAAAEKEQAGVRVFVGGNIGAPLLPRLSDMTARDYAVVELSSFQLMTMQKSAFAAAITNITPNHLNWHTDMAEYTAAKLNVYKYGAKRVVLNADNAACAALLGATGAEEIAFSSTKAPADICAETKIYEADGVIFVNDTPYLKTSDIQIPGRHNVENYMCAIGMTLGLVAPETVTQIAKDFGGVEHRIEFVRTVGGVRYYNSSIDSSPSRTIAALRSFHEKPILICGGRDKHVPFDSLASEILRRAKALVLTGEAREQILSAMQSANEYQPDKIPILIEEDFTNAVLAARRLAAPGDTILLSPACTSFDAFQNFEERGKKFKEIVNGFQE